LYNEEYFLTACEGYDIFEQEAAAGVSRRLAAALRLVEFEPGDRILDIGCGRGEAVLGCAQSGAMAYGVDYSADALRLAHQALRAEQKEPSRCICLAGADAKQLPFADASFDKLLMFDLVEHLYSWELPHALGEAWRVLSSHGQLIIHTAPNRWYYQFGYPLYRLFERSRGRRLPADPRSRFPFHHLHVNEQDVLGLRRSLRHAGFEPRVWLGIIEPPLGNEDSLALKALLRMLLEAYPFRWVFRNDIFAIACKRA
jgi:ubiquinone/menaquinone biosynthesis C-methylase UbiE